MLISSYPYWIPPPHCNTCSELLCVKQIYLYQSYVHESITSGKDEGKGIPTLIGKLKDGVSLLFCGTPTPTPGLEI